MLKYLNKHLFIIIIVIIISFSFFFSYKLATYNKINSSTLLTFDIMESNNHELKKLELNGIYDYNVYYYGLSKVILYYNNQTFDLEKALKENVISMNEIIEESEKYATENKIKSSKYLDGGSTLYRYENLTILKCNTDATNNKDVYIGNKNMDLNDINDLNATLSDDTSWLNNF